MTLTDLLRGITKAEWRYVAWVALTLVVLVSLPYVLVLALTPADHFATGLHFIAPGDVPVYYAYIDAARDGALLFDDPFTAEPHGPFNLNVFWVLVGWFARLASLSAPVAFHVVRVLAVPLFLVVLYPFLALFLRDARRRSFAFTLTAFATGVGWIALVTLTRILPGGDPLASYPMDLWVTEAFPLLSAFQTGHFTFGTTLLLVVLGGTLLAWRSGRIRYSVAAGLAALLLFSFHPFHVVSLAAVLVLWAVLEATRDVSPGRVVFHLGVVALLASPTLLWQALLLAVNPVAAGRAEQNILPITDGWIVLVSYGFLLVGALAALLRRATWRDRGGALVAAWAVGHGLVLFAPLFFVRRLTQGWSIPLAILTAEAGLLLAGFLRTRLRSFGTFLVRSWAFRLLILVALFGMSGAFVLTHDVRLALGGGSRTFAMYLPDEYREAFRAIAAAPGDPVVLASVASGNLTAGFTGRRVYVGHPVETLDFQAKRERVRTFFADTDSAAAQERFLREVGVTHLLWGDAERALGPFDPSTKPYLEPIFEGGRVSVYRLVE